MAPRSTLAAAAALALLPALAACGARSSLDAFEEAPGPGPAVGPQPAPACKPGAPAVTLTPHGVGSWSMAVDATDVYWADRNGALVRKVPKLGGKPVALAETQGPVGIALDDAYVYWIGEGGMGRVPKKGGAPQVLGPPIPSDTVSFLALDDTFAYWTVSDGTVMRVPKDGSAAPVVLLTLGPSPLSPNGPPTPVGIAVGSDRVFFTASLDKATINELDSGELASIPKAGDAATTLAPAENTPWAVALDATTVYWTDNNEDGGAVRSVPLGGGAPANVVGGLDSPANLAVLGDMLYFDAPGNPVFADGGISKVPKQGGAPVIVADNLPGPTAMALDDVCVYWIDDNGVNKIHQ
jgi:hypothetical protein